MAHPLVRRSRKEENLTGFSGIPCEPSVDGHAGAWGVLFLRVEDVRDSRGNKYSDSGTASTVEFEHFQTKVPQAPNHAYVFAVPDFFAAAKCKLKLRKRGPLLSSHLAKCEFDLRDVICLQTKNLERVKVRKPNVTLPKRPGTSITNPLCCPECPGNWFSSPEMLERHMEEKHRHRSVSTVLGGSEWNILSSVSPEERVASLLNPGPPSPEFPASLSIEEACKGGRNPISGLPLHLGPHSSGHPSVCHVILPLRGSSGPISLHPSRAKVTTSGDATLYDFGAGSKGSVRLTVWFVDCFLVHYIVGDLGMSVLHGAALLNAPQLLDKIRSNLWSQVLGVESSIKDPVTLDGLTCINLAAAAGLEEQFMELFWRNIGERNLTVNQVSDPALLQRTSMHFAVLGGSSAIVRQMHFQATHSSMSAQQDALGFTPFALCCALGNARVLDILAHDADPPNQGSLEDISHHVLHTGKIRRAALQTVTYDRESPLLLACKYGSEEAIEMLLSSRVHSVFTHDAAGNTPLLLASRRNLAPTVKMLLEFRAPFVADNDGNSPLHAAVKNENIEIVWLLLKLPRSIKALHWMDASGSTPLSLAKKLTSDAGIELSRLLEAASRIPSVGEQKQDEGDEDASDTAEDSEYEYYEEEASPQMSPVSSSDDGVIESKREPAVLLETKQDVIDMMPPLPPVSRPTLYRQVSWEIMDETELLSVRAALVAEVAATLLVPLHTAGRLLCYFNWDADHLAEAWLLDQPGTILEAGVSENNPLAAFDAWLGDDKEEGLHLSDCSSSSSGSDVGELVECEACLDDVKPSKMFALGCGHKFCLECWDSHLRVAIDSKGPDCVANTFCMAFPSCKQAVDENAWRLLCDRPLFERYSRLLIRSFIDLNPDVKWCPNPKGCDRALRYSGARADLRCGCGFLFCFHCSKEGHSPASCEENEKWGECLAKEIDVASVKVLMNNYKRCPKCKTFIEKSSGCKHMTCQRSAGGCGHEFCFNCGAKWPGYSHQCAHGFSDANPMEARNWNSRETNEQELLDAAATDGGKSRSTWVIHYKAYAQHNNAIEELRTRLVALGKSLHVELLPPTEASTPTNDDASSTVAAPQRRGSFRKLVAPKDGLCSFDRTGLVPSLQHLKKCLTCDPSGGEPWICTSCATACHSGHVLQGRAVLGVCKCGDPSRPGSCSLSRQTQLHRRSSSDVAQSLMHSAMNAAPDENCVWTPPGRGAFKSRADYLLCTALLCLFSAHTTLKFATVHLHFVPLKSDARKLTDFQVNAAEEDAEKLFWAVDERIDPEAMQLDLVDSLIKSVNKLVHTLECQISESAATKA